MDLPSNVRGCNVTQPVCTYSTNCRNTSASNSSITITVGDVTLPTLLIAAAAVPTALPLLYFDQDVEALDPAAAILLLFLMLFLFGGDFCCCYSLVYTSTATQNIRINNIYHKCLYNCQLYIRPVIMMSTFSGGNSFKIL